MTTPTKACWFFFLFLCSSSGISQVPRPHSDQPERPPNIVLFVSDDHGWQDSGAYGDAVVRTPHLDALAAQSMRFTHAFAASPLCSPSRCVIATGLMPHRNGGHKFGTPIRAGIPTMPKYMKDLGYHTVHAGKFHHSPRKAFSYDKIHKKVTAAPKLIRNMPKDKPFLLVACTKPPHTPWVPNQVYDKSQIVLPPNFIDTPETRTDRAKYYSDVTLMDSILGETLAALRDCGLDNNTLFVYTTDQGSNWPFSKWCVYDGGLRVPFLVRWPNRVKPESVSHAMINLVDILPTFMEAASGKPPRTLDGRSMLGVLTGKSREHRKFVFGTHTGNENGGPGIANHCPARTVRTPAFRYIVNLAPETLFTTHITGCKTGPHHLPFWDSWTKKAETDKNAAKIVKAYQHRAAEELFDMEKDPYEMKNLAGDPAYKEIQSTLRKKLLAWCRQQKDKEGMAALHSHFEKKK